MTLKSKIIPNTIIISGNVEKEILQLKKSPGREIIIFGSPSIAHLLTKENLIDDYWLFVNPILLGKGIPLFKGIENTMKLSLVKSHAFRSGVVCLHYKRKA